MIILVEWAVNAQYAPSRPRRTEYEQSSRNFPIMRVMLTSPRAGPDTAPMLGLFLGVVAYIAGDLAGRNAFGLLRDLHVDEHA